MNDLLVRYASGPVPASEWLLRRISAYASRARSAIGFKPYRLGAGGYDPSMDAPGSDGCDCSGFVAWVLGLSRKPKLGRLWWIETTNVWRDATGRQSVFVECDPMLGAIVVYPDGRLTQGHMGIITATRGGRPARVVDCSAAANGVSERPAEAFLRRPSSIACILRQDADWRLR